MRVSLDYTVVRGAHSHKIDLGDGFYFQPTAGPQLANKSFELELRKEGVNEQVGNLITWVEPEIGHTIAGIGVHPDWRGQYLGEKMVKAFVQLYGSLASDPGGTTSPNARRMWERLGAEKVPTDKNTKGFFYLLKK